MVAVWPGTTTWISPAHIQFNFELLSRVAILASLTVGAPGDHGATVAGIQGAGVGTPSAAAVIAITMGFDCELHMPNGRMFSIGMWSMMLAAGTAVNTLFVGNTIKVLGAAPKLHLRVAPIQTCNAIS